MAHTPGNWKVIGEKNNIIITATFKNGSDSYGKPVAYMQTETNCEDSMANAKLMAAAPELLQACKEVLDIINSYQHIPAQFKACQILRDVIKKAEVKNEKD